MNINRITINMDRKCAECNKGGALDNAICLGCMNKAICGHVMRSAIGKEVQRRIWDTLRSAHANRRSKT